jgi:hypothetical protein
MATDQLRGKRLAERDAARDGAVRMLRVIDGNVNALVHLILVGQLSVLSAEC